MLPITEETDWTVIEVKNWDTYNPRNDRKTHAWFRLQNDIMTEPKFFGLSAAQKFCAVCLFAEVSRSGGRKARIHVPWMAHQLGISREEVEQTIAVLLKTRVLCPPTPDDPSRDTDRIPVVTSGDHSEADGSPTDGRTNGRDEQNIQNEPEFARARDTRQDTGPGSGDGYAPGVRDRGPPGGEPEPFDFEVPELIACELEARARVAAAPPPPPRPSPVSPVRRVIAGPWPKPAPPPNPSPPAGYRKPDWAVPDDYVPPGEDFRKLVRGIWGDAYRPPAPPTPVPETHPEEETA